MGKLSKQASERVAENTLLKGDVFTVAKIAGIQAAKNTASILPLCHPINVSHVGLTFEHDQACGEVSIEAVCKCKEGTGIEMEALTAASVAALCIYDMVKAVDQETVITDVRLLSKTKVNIPVEFA